MNSVYANISEWNKSCEDVEIRFTSPIFDLHKTELELDLQRKIEQALREIMMMVDLEEVTTVTIRKSLEEKLSMDLHSRRSWIDEKILVVLEQFNSPSSIRDYLLLGSEGNASDLAELKRQNVTHILNITREVDNFFPNHGFIYKNIRIEDDDEARLLNDWDSTNMFILQAKKQKSRVLVHCKMGVSRSAATVIAHLMKSENLHMDEAFVDVKALRPVIRPNRNFMKQLAEYENILEASNQRKRFTAPHTFHLSPIPGRRILSDANTRSTPDLSMKSKENSTARTPSTPPNTPGSKKKIVTDSINFPLGAVQIEPFSRFNGRDKPLSGVHRSQSMRERGSYSKVELQRWSGQEYEDYEHLAPGVIQRRLRALTEPETRNIESEFSENNHVIPQGFVQQQAQTIERSASPEVPKSVRENDDQPDTQEQKTEHKNFEGQTYNHNQSFYQKEGQEKNRFQVQADRNHQTSNTADLESRIEIEIRAPKFCSSQAHTLIQDQNTVLGSASVSRKAQAAAQSTAQASAHYITRNSFHSVTHTSTHYTVHAFIQPSISRPAPANRVSAQNQSQNRVIGRLRSGQAFVQHQLKADIPQGNLNQRNDYLSESSVEEYADAGPRRQNNFRDYETDSEIDYNIPFQWMKADQLAKLRRAIANNTRKNTETSF